MKKSLTVKVVCVLLAALVMLYSPGSLRAQALEPPMELSEQYRSGEFFSALKAVELTGNLRSDIAAIALSQVGYHEGSSLSDLDGKSDSKANFTEYGRCYGTADDAWCAMFVWWCARMAGVHESIIRKTEWAKVITYDCPYVRYSESADVQVGDLVFFDNSGKDGVEDHVGLVVGADDASIITVEGNTSNSVCRYTYNRSSGKRDGSSAEILYIAKPDYSGANTSSFTHSTAFILAESQLDVYSSPGGSTGGTIAPGNEYLLLAHTTRSGGQWYQLASGVDSFWIKAEGTQTVYHNVPPVTSYTQPTLPPETTTHTSAETTTAAETAAATTTASETQPVQTAGDTVPTQSGQVTEYHIIDATQTGSLNAGYLLCYIGISVIIVMIMVISMFAKRRR